MTGQSFDTAIDELLLSGTSRSRTSRSPVSRTVGTIMPSLSTFPGPVMDQGCRRPDRDFDLRLDKLELGHAMARLVVISNDEIFVAGLKSLLGGAGHDVVSA